jgi:IPT/TIG domain
LTKYKYTTMNKYRSIFLNLLYILLTLSISCNEDGDEIDRPTIISISPNKAPAGKLVTIEGTNFSLSKFDNDVEFNDIKASALECTRTSIVVKVPSGATTGPVKIKVKGKGEAISANNFIVTDCSECGVIEKFILSGQCSVEPINATRLTYSSDMASKRGFNFTMDKKSRLKSIGGFFRKPGTYTLELLRWGMGLTPFYTTTITVDDTENFVFTDVDTNIELLPYPAQYLIRYCDEDHSSVYDVYAYVPNSNGFFQPFDFGEVNLQSIYYYYLTDCTKPSDVSGWQNQIVFMRGVVDFKYEVIN